jgi:hypothetical protein
MGRTTYFEMGREYYGELRLNVVQQKGIYRAESEINQEIESIE